MPEQNPGVVVGLDNGGTSNNATVLDHTGRFLVDHMLESRSRVQEGPGQAIEALAEAFTGVLEVTGTPREAVLAVGLDTPGPASAAGVISTRGGGAGPGGLVRAGSRSRHGGGAAIAARETLGLWAEPCPGHRRRQT